VGDTIVISSSEFKLNHHEEVNISSIAGTEITLSEALKFHHYGNGS